MAREHAVLSTKSRLIGLELDGILNRYKRVSSKKVHGVYGV